MTTPDRKLRSQRTTALTCAVMAEVVMGGAVLVWSGSPATADGSAFGRAGSIGVVGGAMVVLAVAMVAAALAGRLGRGTLVTVVSVLFVVLAGVVVTAVTVVQSAPGVGILLIFAWLLAIPVALHIRRGSVSSTGQRQS
jgi:hypothetical protein